MNCEKGYGYMTAGYTEDKKHRVTQLDETAIRRINALFDVEDQEQNIQNQILLNGAKIQKTLS